MIEITDEMRDIFDNELWDISFNHQLWKTQRDKVIKRIIELHEANKPKPEPAGYTLDVLKEYFYAGFMSSGEGFNGEWGGMKSCDTAWEEYSATQNKLQEANKPKPEPVGYIYNSRLEQMLNSEVDNDCNFFPIKDDISRVIFNRNRDKYLALYTTPPTREPLSEVEILKLALRDCYPIQFVDRSYGITLDKVTVVDFARLIEQAHGIGVTND